MQSAKRIKDNTYTVALSFNSLEEKLEQEDKILETLNNLMERELKEGVSNREIQEVVSEVTEDDKHILRIIIKDN